MAFTGYTFNSKDEISKEAELCMHGKTFNLCFEVANRLNSYVICGYPEKTGEGIYYNSAYILDRKGNLISNYRKKQLYEADKPWATEGPCFFSFFLKSIQGDEFKIALGICMDINPYEGIDPQDFGFGEFCKKENVDIVCLCTAWSDTEPEIQTQKSIIKNLDYWIYRLNPLLDDRNRLLVVANKVGKEEKVVFAGSSCVVQLKPVQIIQFLNKINEGIMSVETGL